MDPEEVVDEKELEGFEIETDIPEVDDLDIADDTGLLGDKSEEEEETEEDELLGYMFPEDEYSN